MASSSSPSSSPSPTLPMRDHSNNGEEEEHQPPLLQASIQLKLKDFRVTCAACRNDLIALGSDTGMVLLLDAHSYRELGSFKSGRQGTCEVDFDASGTLIATADKDGTVSVRTISQGKQPGRIQLEEKHSASFMASGSWHIRIAIDPSSYKNGDFAFACGGGDGRVLITKKNWFFSSKTDALSSSRPQDGGITKLSWRGDVIAWINANGGLKIHDTRLEVTILSHPRTQPYDPSKFTDVLVWENDDTLLFGWDNVVGIVKIKDTGESSPKRAGIAKILENPCPIVYVSPFGGRNGRLAMFGADGEVRLVERRTGVAVSSIKFLSEVHVKGIAIMHDAFWSSAFLSNLPEVVRSPTDDPAVNSPLQKGTVQEETQLPYLYIIREGSSSDDVELLVVRSRTIEDSLQYALSRNDFERALAIARGAHSERWCSMGENQVADAWLTNLFAQQQYEKIAEILPGIVKASDTATWAKWSAVLAERRQLSRLVETLPKGLPVAVYDAALSELLSVSTKESDIRYTDLIRRLAGTIDAERAAGEIADALKVKPGRMELKPALAVAYSLIPHRSEDAFWAMLDSKWMDAFDVLERASSGHTLLMRVFEKSRIADLCALDEDRCLALIYPFISSSSAAAGDLTEEEQAAVYHFFPSIIAQLRERAMDRAALRLLRKWNSARRAELSSQGGAPPSAPPPNSGSQTGLTTSTDLYDLEVELCAKVDRPRLLELLRDTNGYSPDKALAICRSGGRADASSSLARETVFLLQRMGGPVHSTEALHMLVNEMNDLDSALEYAERDNLFDELVRICVSPNAKPILALELLGRAGGYSIDPARLVRALPAGLPDVRDKLLKLFQDVRTTQASRGVANKVFAKDAATVMGAVRKQFMRGVRVSTTSEMCLLCGCLLEHRDLVVFRTGHVYHHECLTKSSAMFSTASRAAIMEEVSAASLVKQHCVIFGAAQNSK